MSYLLGHPLVGIRTEATLSLINYLQLETAATNDATLQIVAVGSAGLPALHAAALEPDTVSSLTLRKTLPSWKHVVDAPLGHQHLCETVHGVLATYDLPDLISLVDARKVTIEQPATPK